MILIPNNYKLGFAVCEHYWEPSETDAEDMPDLLACGYTSPGFYFFDETQTEVSGPYLTYSSCCAHASKYFKQLYGEINDNK